MEPANQKHILVVDDEPSDLHLLTEILESAGYRVTQAKTGAEALRAAKAGWVDLALVDLLMPGLDGYAVIGMLTRDRSFKSPVLVISGRVDERDAAQALKTGAAGFIAKPVDREKLLAKVAELVGKQG